MREIHFYLDSEGMVYARFVNGGRIVLNWFVPYDASLDDLIMNWIEKGMLPKGKA